MASLKHKHYLGEVASTDQNKIRSHANNVAHHTTLNASLVAPDVLGIENNMKRIKQEASATTTKANLAIKAYAVNRFGKKKRIDANAIQVKLAEGGLIRIPLAGLPNNQVLSLVTGGSVSGDKNDHSSFVVYPGCSNVIYLHVQDFTKAENMTPPTRP